MKSALKKSVVSTSISLILASGMAAFAAHAADDVKLKATKTNVAFSDFTPTEYSTKGKPNIIVLTMDDLGYGQLPFDKGSFDPKTMENREVVDTYKIGIDKAIEAAQKSTPTLLSLMDEGVRFTNGYVAHGVSGPSRAAIMTGRAPARFGVYSNTDAQDGIPLTLHAAEFSAALLSEIAMHVTAKPSSFQCNLKCDYCFYLEKESQFTHEKWMDDSTLKEFIKQYIAASGNQVYFTWQGGEPTLAGLDFFRKVIHYQQRYAGQKRIFNALQTNGILLNNEWCAFLKEHEFLVGISIDGPQELHDRYRRSNSGNGTFAKVIAAIERLKSYQVEFNTLTVINNVNVHYPLEVYHFLKSIGSKHMQFIELLETGTPNIDFSGHSENTFRIIDFSVPPTAYGKFMSTIFMQWVKNDVGEIFIRQFESFVSRFLGNGHTSCIFQESCKDNLVVESNGDIYECDHFVYPQYKIGNINKSELKTMNSVQLTAQKKRISAKCQQCAYKPICNGGCPKHRITKVNNETVSYFCEGYKILFSTMVPYMNAMVELAKNRVPLYHIMDVAKQMENN